MKPFLNFFFVVIEWFEHLILRGMYTNLGAIRLLVAALYAMISLLIRKIKLRFEKK